MALKMLSFFHYRSDPAFSCDGIAAMHARTGVTATDRNGPISRVEYLNNRSGNGTTTTIRLGSNI